MEQAHFPHYHIRWSVKASLDWTYFPLPTHAEAEENARQLVPPGETYTIEEHDESCLQCMKLAHTQYFK
jgi:hypothetical protein